MIRSFFLVSSRPPPPSSSSSTIIFTNNRRRCWNPTKTTTTTTRTIRTSSRAKAVAEVVAAQRRRQYWVGKQQKEQYLWKKQQYQSAYSFSSLIIPDSFSSSDRYANTNTINTNPIQLQKVLIANRGEIACRINRTCQLWDINTVSVYSIADTARAYHASQANESYLIGTGSSPKESYLLQDELISIAVRTNCDAIHPGYGFLSENAAFAAKCRDANIRFIGPSPAAIHAMGNKSQSKAIMDQAGVPTTPGYYEKNNSSTDEKQDSQLLYEKAKEIGYPILIKAVAGGGGKGMRIVWKESEFYESLQSCQNESLASFSNDHVLLEKYLYNPRHIEVQIIGDTHGNIVHLYERDCSVQRRHQKVFEEAPANIDIHPTIRTQLGTMGILAGKAVNYINAGTVEFLLDTNNKDEIGTEQQKFYFCEMNTRLQVEHPVTELITGIDLIEWQLRVADDQRLPIIDQNNIPCIGHAIEARIYAENPYNHFLPATGKLLYHNYTTTTKNHKTIINSTTNNNNNVTNIDNNNVMATASVRVDTGLRTTTITKEENKKQSSSLFSKNNNNNKNKYHQEEVSVYYDPMISKLIVHGINRTVALQQLIKSLKSYHIIGLPTNIPFLIKCAQHPTFQKGGQYVNTGFLIDYANDIQLTNNNNNSNNNNKYPPIMAQLAGSLAILLHLENRTLNNNNNNNNNVRTNSQPWSTHWGSWRMGGNKAKQILRLPNIIDHTNESNKKGKKHNNSNNNNDESNNNISIWKNQDGTYDIQTVTGTEEIEVVANNEDNKFHVSGWFNTDTNKMEIIVNRTHRIQLTTVLVIDYDENAGASMVRVRMWPERFHGYGSNNDDDNDSSSSYYWELDVENPLFPSPSLLSAAVSGTATDSTSGGGDGGSNRTAFVRSPMPGKITRVNYKVGDSVNMDDIVVVMEAMKMEHPLKSPRAGFIREIRYQPNDVVNKDGTIIFVVTNDNNMEDASATTTKTPPLPV